MSTAANGVLDIFFAAGILTDASNDVIGYCAGVAYALVSGYC
jgi:hypothetical protein